MERAHMFIFITKILRGGQHKCRFRLVKVEDPSPMLIGIHPAESILAFFISGSASGPKGGDVRFCEELEPGHVITGLGL